MGSSVGGVAGCKFVKNLIKFGHKLIVWYENLGENSNFVLNGAEKAATPSKVIEKVAITSTCGTDPLAGVAVKEVVQI